MEGAQLINIPEEFRGVVKLADRRIAGIMAAWARGGNYDLGFLCRSIYLQGVQDAAEAEEQRRAKHVVDVSALRRRKVGR